MTQVPVELKTIFVASGDHAGRPPKLPTVVGLVPSAFMTQMPPQPWSTILVPSGENFGLMPDAAIRVFVPLARLNTQIPPWQTYAIFPASAAGVGVADTIEVGVDVGCAAVSVPAPKSSRATLATSGAFLNIRCPRTRKGGTDEVLFEGISLLLMMICGFLNSS